MPLTINYFLMTSSVIISNLWSIISFLQKAITKRLMRIVFSKRVFSLKRPFVIIFFSLYSPPYQKELFGAKQLMQTLQTAIYQIPFGCLTWSKQLKSSQIAIFIQIVACIIVTKHPLSLYCYHCTLSDSPIMKIQNNQWQDS